MTRTERPAAPAHRLTRLVGGLLAVAVSLLTWGCSTQAETSVQPEISGVDRPVVDQPQTKSSEQKDPTADAAEPEVADPVAVEAAAASVDTTLVQVGLEDNGQMELPDPGTGAWYELGPRPGEPGSAVIVGHVDSVDGPDVFYGLSLLGEGDTIHVADAAGTRRTFVVDAVERVPKDALPYDRIRADIDEPVLRLITCGGTYDSDNGGYQDNIVVYANLQGIGPAD